jgi:hypothetical protein
MICTAYLTDMLNPVVAVMNPKTIAMKQLNMVKTIILHAGMRTVPCGPA